MKVHKNNKSGFTLIELLVVIAIISLLSSIVSSSLSNARSKARDAVRLSDIRQISTALELYYSDRGSYPVGEFLSLQYTADPLSFWRGDPSLNNALVLALEPYLKKIPTDPRNNDSNCYANGAHFYTYESPTGKSYGIYASLENPRAGAQDPLGPTGIGYPTGYPCCASTCMYKATNGGVGIVN